MKTEKGITQIAIERQYTKGNREDKILFEYNGTLSINEAVTILKRKIKSLWRVKTHAPFFERFKGQWEDDQIKLGHVYGTEDKNEKVFAVYIMGKGALKAAKKLNRHV